MSSYTPIGDKEFTENRTKVVELFQDFTPAVVSLQVQKQKYTQFDTRPKPIAPKRKIDHDQQQQISSNNNEEEVKKKPVQRINAKSKSNLYNFDAQDIIYDQYLPLHDLWTQYTFDLLKGHSPMAFQTIFLRADLHGAIILVVKSKCPSYIGQCGIVLQETENVFKIVTKDNGLRLH
ncbi:RNase P protein subunit [Cavenderia fasciculata]|uniref:RNase P protein subunit n=1 Tax=Cavenderia fasciculata TaxID=261658 RepID=F4QD13_CACFS|nr:RNase P protein subunit [Cavenderia fasciculata]EGG13694.1 RNase P protein subunit [Cavenderia fasciculata]|eukprot:XP_004350398.1 RNase P protein subunit [Cavenderia fasciculata]